LSDSTAFFNSSRLMLPLWFVSMTSKIGVEAGGAGVGAGFGAGFGAALPFVAHCPAATAFLNSSRLISPLLSVSTMSKVHCAFEVSDGLGAGFGAVVGFGVGAGVGAWGIWHVKGLLL
jgi:hypothetical protein